MSCCQCLKIKILDPITGMPTHFLESGALYLDLPENFSLELSKSATRLSLLEKIEDEAAIEFDLPYTPKNEIIGRFVRNHNQIENDYPPLSVLVQEGSITHHTFTELFFTGSSDQSQVFSVKLTRSTGHWIRGAKEKYLNTIDYGTFELTVDNITDNWANNYQHTDGGQGVYWPICHYGAWVSETSIVLEDLRPWLHALFVLQQGFCEIGWSFRCPALETDTGRQLITYILREDYAVSQADVDFFRFLASGTPTIASGIIIFPDEDYDYSGSYNPATGQFSGAVDAIFMASVTVEANANSGSGDTPQLFIQLVKESGGFAIDFASLSFSLSETTETFTANLQGQVSLEAGDKVYIYAYVDGSGNISPTGGYFTNEPQRVPPGPGDVIEIADFVHPDYILLDFLKGIAHMLNGRFITDWVNKTVWLYTPNDAVWFSEGVDGFYQSTVEDLTDLILPESEEITLEKTGQARYVKLQFKGSTDDYINSMDLEAAAPLYSKEVDLGEGFIEETEQSENPFFEPTANAIINKFPAISPEVTTYNIDIPHLWDNDNGETSYKIGPRILYALGYVYQIYDESGSDTTRKYKFNNSTFEQIGYCFQRPNSKYALAALDPGITLEDRIVYGESDNDLYTLAYNRELLTRKFANQSAFLMRVSSQRYRVTDFRKLYTAYYGGRTFNFRMEEISSYNTCGTDNAVVVVRPEPFVGDICADVISVDPDTCNNMPRIDITVNVSGDWISADADDSGIDSPINTDDWEYSTNGGTSWSAYTPDDQISGFESVVFRREVSFTDGCPTKIVTRTGSFDTACDNNPGITLDYTEGTNTITAEGSGTFNSSIATDVFEVSIDGASYVAYTELDPVTGFETVTFRRTVTYINSCPEQVVTATYTVTGAPCENDISIVFTEVLPGACVYSLSITGATSPIAFVSFQVSEDGGTYWRNDIGNAVRRTSTTIARAFVYYSDGCPASTIEAECP